MLVHKQTSDDPTVTRFLPPMNLSNRIYRRAREALITRDLARYENSRPAGYDLFNDDRTRYARDLVPRLPVCDIINLHWIARFVDYHRFFADIPARTPIVWRLADMNALTGGCHFDEGCGKFVTGCGACPQLGSNDPKDLSREIFQRKFAALNRLRSGQLHIVVLNKAMVTLVKASPLLGKFSVSVIPNGLDTNEFAPRNKQAAREILGLPLNKQIILFAAESIELRRKGFDLLVAALSGFSRPNELLVVSIGRGQTQIQSPIAHRHLGSFQDDRMLSVIYSAADLFVFPSLQETFGQTALEAMACGTPVVGFDGVGCIPELVSCDVTGRKVPMGDVAALRSAIAKLLQNPAALNQMSVQCRRLVVERFNLERQAKSYAQLYQSLIDSFRSGAVRRE
jgi:glycosyltransferase involved in cell wall biosynthesis